MAEKDQTVMILIHWRNISMEVKLVLIFFSKSLYLSPLAPSKFLILWVSHLLFTADLHLFSSRSFWLLISEVMLLECLTTVSILPSFESLDYPESVLRAAWLMCCLMVIHRNLIAAGFFSLLFFLTVAKHQVELCLGQAGSQSVTVLAPQHFCCYRWVISVYLLKALVCNLYQGGLSHHLNGIPGWRVIRTQRYQKRELKTPMANSLPITVDLIYPLWASQDQSEIKLSMSWQVAVDTSKHKIWKRLPLWTPL